VISTSLAAMCAAAPAPYGIDLQGRPVRELAGTGVHVVVLVFAASDCPISNRYVPEITRLNHEFESRGVKFWWVFPNPSDTAQVVAQHDRAFSIAESTILDRQQNLVRWSQATTTPEAVVFQSESGALREVYRGRIDDRYISLGQERPAPQHHDLENAIAAALASKSIPEPDGPPVGCSIVFLQR